MSYIKKSLLDDETLFYQFKPHWAYYLLPVMLMLFSLVLYGIKISVTAWLAGSSLADYYWAAKLGLDVDSLPTFGDLSIVGIVMAIYWALYIKFLEYGITNKRVVRKLGVIGRKTAEMKLTTIETVKIDQSVIGRLMGFGHIIVTGYGMSAVVFRLVEAPLIVKRQMEAVVEREAGPSKPKKRTGR